ncbi:efflux RND transporter periplasmic adaptor subunit [Enhygromyxa salina]|uniref:efflux RND transporter periplasmic adaptor subunit n=1 Tax=Enhygromyxa salina TaxID=215803 RepID=UPI0011BAAF75|nr:efflux RND transporter periplasmic adaptor subunit [Enhygromyxa salina]
MSSLPAKLAMTLALAVPICLAGCDKPDQQGEQAGAADLGVPRIRVAPVQEVVPQVSSRHLVLLAPWRQAQLSPRFGGQIAELLIAEQTEVAADQLLVRLVDADARGSLISAQASRTSSEKRLVDLDRQLADARKLLETGAGTRREVERLETEIETTRASIRQASGQVIQSRDRRQANEILAPFAGVITSLDAELGEYASPGARLATLSELDILAVDVPLSEFEMVVHERGALEFQVMVRGQPVDTSLEWIAREADSGTNTFPARLRINNADKRLRAGEAAEVFVRGDKGKPELVVPPTAVRWESTQAYLLRATTVGSAAQGGEQTREQLERVDVSVHEDVGGQVAVSGPLAVGDRVVSSGPSTLVDGDEAIMIPQVTAPGRVTAPARAPAGLSQ